MSNSDVELMLNGHGLTTAEITYRMPDFQSVLQTFVWQDYDLAPKFPKLTDFLAFWRSGGLNWRVRCIPCAIRIKN